jgi:hypothetical protein
MKPEVTDRGELHLSSRPAQRHSKPKARALPRIRRRIGGSHFALGADPLGAELALKLQYERYQLDVVVVRTQVDASQGQL